MNEEEIINTLLRLSECLKLLNDLGKKDVEAINRNIRII